MRVRRSGASSSTGMPAPTSRALSAAAALETVYRQIRDTGSSLGSSAPLYSFAEMNRLMGFDTAA